MKYVEYKQKLDPLVKATVSLLHKREMHAIVHKDNATLKAMGDQILENMQEVLRLQDAIAGREIEVDDIKSMLSRLIGENNAD